MPSFCAVATCNDRYGHSENISFHKFPLKRLHLLKQWEAFIQSQRGENWHASRWSSLCSRHFREEDFRSLNERRTLKKTAVPSILVDNEGGINGAGNSKRKPTEKVVNTLEDTREKEFKEILAIKERLEDTVVDATSTVLNVPKTNCRLCGIASTPSANFLENYELYGLMQKCFPTINIQREDALPKVICAVCHRHLENFGTFVDRVWTAQTDLQRKFRTRTAEKPVKIKQEPLVRVKQEVAETGYEERKDTNGLGGVNEDYDGATDGGVHDEEDEQKYEFCDFPIINDCDIMEIINLDDPFINIPDDDNTTAQNEEEEILHKPTHESVMNYMPTAHELLQSHLLMEEHNYAYIDADEFKEERQIYKTEKSDNDERVMDFTTSNVQEQQQHQSVPYSTDVPSSMNHHNNTNNLEHTDSFMSKIAAFEKRALKPIVTSVSAIQQPTKSSSNGIVVLNESIVKSGCGFQLHACMVCHLKFFSVESLKQHYTQTHGTPMVTVPGENIFLERLTQNTCKMEKEFSENVLENTQQIIDTKTKETDSIAESNCTDVQKESNFKETKEEPDIFVDKSSMENKNPTQAKIDILPHDSTKSSNEPDPKSSSYESKQNVLQIKRKKNKLKVPIKSRKQTNVSLNTMATQYQQLRKLYQKLQKKCTNLEHNVEQLQLLPATITNKKTGTTSKNSSNQKSSKIKIIPNSKSTEIANIKAVAKKIDFTCVECSKSFSNSNSLRQHKITHSEERKHHCSLCQRTFKRRNGLLQHLKGFHLQVKPFSCPVCKHCYALKCDMLRCKHSTIRNSQKSSSEKINIHKGRLVLKDLDK